MTPQELKEACFNCRRVHDPGSLISENWPAEVLFVDEVGVLLKLKTGRRTYWNFAFGHIEHLEVYDEPTKETPNI